MEESGQVRSGWNPREIFVPRGWGPLPSLPVRAINSPAYNTNLAFRMQLPPTPSLLYGGVIRPQCPYPSSLYSPSIPSLLPSPHLMAFPPCFWVFLSHSHFIFLSHFGKPMNDVFLPTSCSFFFLFLRFLLLFLFLDSYFSSCTFSFSFSSSSTFVP